MNWPDVPPRKRARAVAHATFSPLGLWIGRRINGWISRYESAMHGYHIAAQEKRNQ